LVRVLDARSTAEIWSEGSYAFTFVIIVTFCLDSKKSGWVVLRFDIGTRYRKMKQINLMFAFSFFALGWCHRFSTFAVRAAWRQRDTIALPKCDAHLKPLDLVPIVSQVMLRARCRYYGSKIAWRYAGIKR